MESYYYCYNQDYWDPDIRRMNQVNPLILEIMIQTGEIAKMGKWEGVKMRRMRD